MNVKLFFNALGRLHFDAKQHLWQSIVFTSLISTRLCESECFVFGCLFVVPADELCIVDYSEKNRFMLPSGSFQEKFNKSFDLQT